MNMKKPLRRSPSGLLRIVAPALTLSVLAHSAHGEMLYAQNTFFTGTAESQTVSVDAPSAGTMTVTLSDLVWPAKLASLSFYSSNETSVLSAASFTGTTQQTYDLTGAGAFYAHISADAGSFAGLNFGWYSVDISFAPQQAPVPLPASEGLLLMGLAAMGALGILRRVERSSGTPGLVAT